jgi:hypothetical protein
MLYWINALCDATVKVIAICTFSLIEKQTLLVFHGVSKDHRIAVGVRILYDRKFKWRNNLSLFEQLNAVKLKIEIDLDSSVTSRQVGW